MKKEKCKFEKELIKVIIATFLITGNMGYGAFNIEGNVLRGDNNLNNYRGETPLSSFKEIYLELNNTPGLKTYSGKFNLPTTDLSLVINGANKYNDGIHLTNWNPHIVLNKYTTELNTPYSNGLNISRDATSAYAIFNEVDIKTTNDSSHGIRVNSSKMNGGAETHKATINTLAKILTNGKNSRAVYAGADELLENKPKGKVEIYLNGDTIIKTTGAEAYGISAGKDGYIEVGNLDLETTGNNSYGLIASNTSLGGIVLGGANRYGSTIILKGDSAKIHSLKGKAIFSDSEYAKISTEEKNILLDIKGAIEASDKGIIKLSSSKNSLIDGDIIAKTKGNINLDLNESKLIGKINDGRFNGNTGIVDINLNNSLWNVTGKSAVSSLNLKNKGQVNFDNNKTSIDIKNLQGDQTGIFSLNVNSLNKADGNMIYVQESSGGEYQVSLQNSNLEDIQIGDKIRFATIGTDAKLNNLSFKVADVKEKGIKDVSFKVEKLDYEHNDEENKIYNGEVADENKLGNDYVNNNYGDSENWYLSRVENEGGNEGGNNRINDIGIVIIEAAKSNYANAIYMDTLNKRLGDMSFANGNEGLWVRVKNDRVGEDDQYRLSNYTTQIGYDKLKLVSNGVEHNGIAFEYSKGDLDYKNLNGNSDVDKYIVTLYKTKLRNNDIYTDYTLRGGALANDFTVYGRETGTKVVGKFKNMLLGAGSEIGKKFKFNKNWYFEPQAQLQYTYINSTDYTTNQMTKVKLDEIHSLIGRAGIRVGQDFYKNNLKNSTIYVKADVNHEFLGKQNVEATDITGSLSETYHNNETWYDLGIGITKSFTSNLNGYMDIEQQFGSNKDNKSWQANIGFRYKF